MVSSPWKTSPATRWICTAVTEAVPAMTPSRREGRGLGRPGEAELALLQLLLPPPADARGGQRRPGVLRRRPRAQRVEALTHEGQGLAGVEVPGGGDQDVAGMVDLAEERGEVVA